MGNSIRHAVVTGATQGIGLETSRALLDLGWRVTLVGRNPSALEQVRADLANPTHISTRVADLSSLRQTNDLANQLLDQGEPIHALINNAGAYFHPRQTTAEGVEATWALNHLAPFGLTRAVEPLLRAASSPGEPARVVVVSSNAHSMAKKPPLEDLEFAQGYRAMQAYARSKLANVLFVREQARRWEQEGAGDISINAVHPGVVGTRFFRDNGFFGWFWRTLLDRVAITPAEGAKGLVRLATDPALAGVTGKYFSRETEKQPAKLALDDALARQVYEASAKRWQAVLEAKRA